jgi:hypothetical protein
LRGTAAGVQMDDLDEPVAVVPRVFGRFAGGDLLGGEC